MNFKLVLGALLALTFAGSVGTRAFLGEPKEPKSASPAVTSPGGLAQGLVPSGDAQRSSTPATEAAPPSPALERYLPVITEASFFAILGFAIGYATRKVVKLLLIVLALIFAAVMGLWHLGILGEPNWGRAVELVNQFVLNVKKDQTFTQWVRTRIPSAGGFLTGIVLGYRKG